ANYYLQHFLDELPIIMEALILLPNPTCIASPHTTRLPPKRDLPIFKQIKQQ
uniref:Uncharacterized protein n=1 Tax=Myotis lucifugus TaxID=59463 RepID=G1Q9W6_MYOLU